MENLKMHTPDLADENFKKLAALFPNAVTETKDENGNVVRAIDADVLRQEISATVVEGPQERYQFTWPDKKKTVVLANQPIAKTLRLEREKSVGKDGTPGNIDTENIYIEGDNLDALKLLQETYLGKVKMIYIDPPYNTGNDFIYEDDFSQDADDYLGNSGQFDEEGNRLVQNTESNGRFHTDWLNMLYPRLRLAKDLLTDDGVIFISIDDNEVSNLKKICDEIFGAGNFVAQLAVQLNPRGRNLDRYVAKTHESVLIFVKNYLNTACILGVEKEGKMVNEYNKEDERGKYRLIGLRNRNQAFNPITRPNLYYPLYVNPSNKKVSTKADSEFTDEVWPDTPDGIKTCWTWMSKKVDEENNLITAELSGEKWRIFRKDYLISEDGKAATTLIKSIWTENIINNDYGKKSIKELFGSNVMSFPKPPELIKRMIAIGSRKDSIVMDFSLALPQPLRLLCKLILKPMKIVISLWFNYLRFAQKKLKLSKLATRQSVTLAKSVSVVPERKSKKKAHLPLPILTSASVFSKWTVVIWKMSTTALPITIRARWNCSLTISSRTVHQKICFSR